MHVMQRRAGMFGISKVSGVIGLSSPPTTLMLLFLGFVESGSRSAGAPHKIQVRYKTGNGYKAGNRYEIGYRFHSGIENKSGNGYKSGNQSGG